MKNPKPFGPKDGMYSLAPLFDSRQSFHGKAYVKQRRNSVVLVSYGLKICRIDWSWLCLTILCREEELSQTTRRHLREFLLQQDMGKYLRLDLTKINLANWCREVLAQPEPEVYFENV